MTQQLHKLWAKTTSASRNEALAQTVDRFTVGHDRVMDVRLAPFDVLGSIAHGVMLRDIGLLTADECRQIIRELRRLYADILADRFVIADEMEDVHSQIEFLLTQSLGDIGKKIHSGRSRNDQALTDIKLYLRSALEMLVHRTVRVFERFCALSTEYDRIPLPGYTHYQIAMPSSFGLWFGAYAESLCDDMHSVQAAFDVVNKNPLGSAAGYGSSFPLDRHKTTQLLGFADMNVNAVYAQMTRGKSERITAQAMASIAGTLNRFASDITLYMCGNFGFVRFPEEITTGSSIMPHKKNPDVFELIRARTNALMALPNTLTMTLNSLPSGYHRDVQILKEYLFPHIDMLIECLDMLDTALAHIEVNTSILDDPKYAYLFTVDDVNALVMQGHTFRDAYRIIGERVAQGLYTPNHTATYTHIGSIGRSGIEEIRRMMQTRLSAFPFEHIAHAQAVLLENEL